MPKNKLQIIILLLFTIIGCSSIHADTFLFGNDPKPNLPVDIRYSKCLHEWDGKIITDWYRCAYDAEKAWDVELNRYYRQLLRLLPDTEKTLIINSQRAWLNHYEMKKKILTQTFDMNILVGREGFITVLDNLVQMKRIRTLELHDYIELQILQKEISSSEP